MPHETPPSEDIKLYDAVYYDSSERPILISDRFCMHFGCLSRRNSLFTKKKMSTSPFTYLSSWDRMISLPSASFTLYKCIRRLKSANSNFNWSKCTPIMKLLLFHQRVCQRNHRDIPAYKSPEHFINQEYIMHHCFRWFWSVWFVGIPGVHSWDRM